MRAYSMDRERALLDSDAGIPDVAAKYRRVVGAAVEATAARDG